MEQNKWSSIKIVQIIPVLNDFSHKNEIASTPPVVAWHAWDLMLCVFFGGMIVLLTRLILQWLSYLNIKRNAQLLLDDNVNIYEVNKNIIPFSFGRSVFINPQIHNPEELKEILRHEHVHVREKHTIDIIWAEILCLFNWYNPFAWLIRHSIRQNLEFIADHKVLENGVEKKQYQYLLLKVMGFPQFNMAAPFNFSSLKKRIFMMNKMRSAKVHLLKFLFALPLLVVLLLAFRMTKKETGGAFQSTQITVSGLVVHGNSYEPLGGVHFKEAGFQIEGNTDQRGFYTLNIPATDYPYKVNIVFTKEGYKNMESKYQIGTKNNLTNKHSVDFIGMSPQKTDATPGGFFMHSFTPPDKTSLQVTYEMVAKKFEQLKQSGEEVITLQKQSAGSQKPYWIINGHTYLINSDGAASVDTITDIVFVDGKKMTGKEVNEKFERSKINTVGAMEKEAALKKYGINQEVMEIFVNGEPASGSVSKESSN